MKQLMLSAGLLCMTIFAFAQNGERSKDYPRFEKETQKRTRDNAKGAFQQRFDLQIEDDLRGDKSEKDQIGFTHDKYQQYYKNVKVEGAVYTAHSKNNVIESYSGEFKGIKNFDVNPSVSASQAFNAALQHAGGNVYAWDNSVRAGYPEYSKPSGELVIIGGGANDNEDLTLAWKYDVYSVEPLYRAEVYIDAKTGSYVRENLLIHTANTPTTATTLYNGAQPIVTDQVSATSFRLREIGSISQGIETYNLNKGTNYGTATDFTSADNITWSDAVGTQAHFGAEVTYNYYYNKLGRNSFNNSGAKILSYVHYSNNYANAFWDGSRMTYGDGSPTSSLSKPLVSVDVCGHEITHGVTTYSANLTYSYESGALNESFSDIFGECIENYAKGSNDWIMGCEITSSASCGIRSMANPKLKSQPEYYKGQYWYTGTADGGGVHTNSGVQNKWFYLITMGGSFTNEKGASFNLTGLGIDKAAAIAYRTLTTYLTPSSNYLNTRNASIKAAEDLYGGTGNPAALTVASAWDAVGVVPDVQAPTAPTTVSITTKSTTSIGLTWKGATDNVGVTAYDVYYQTGTGAYLVKSNITTTTYSLTGLTANTSYNIYVIAKDGSGNVSPASSTINVKTLASNETLVGAYYFETSLSPWTAGGTNAIWTNNATYAYEGVGSAQTRGSGATAVLNSPKLNLTGYTQVELKFNFTPVGMLTGQGIIVKYNNNGTMFTALPTISTNGLAGFYTATILFNAPTYTFNTNGKFTIECAGATTANQIYIDAVTVIGRKSTTGTGSTTTITPVSKGIFTLGLTNAMAKTTFESNLPENAKLYPNPVYSQLLINANSQVKAIRIFNANGTMVKSMVGKAGYSSMDMSRLNKGIYFAEIISADGIVRKKIVKQ